MMTYMIIGLIVGLIMGLTGAGGALISIPLFISLLGSSLKEATLLSLFAVLFGTFTSLFGQFKKVSWKIVLGFAIFGFIGNFASLTLKSLTPDWAIAVILSLIGAYSIFSVWKKKQNQTEEHARGLFIKVLLAGLLIGVITTLTGLGGGVILIPLLIRFFGKTHSEALPTSLATIFIISLSSLLLQIGEIGLPIGLMEVAGLGAGAGLSFVTLKVVLKYLSSGTAILMRKYVFTLVTLYSVMSVLIKIIKG